MLGLYDYLDEYENIDELNEQAHATGSTGQGRIGNLCGALLSCLGKTHGGVKDLINLTQNLDPTALPGYFR